MCRNHGQENLICSFHIPITNTAKISRVVYKEINNIDDTYPNILNYQ